VLRLGNKRARGCFGVPLQSQSIQIQNASSSFGYSISRQADSRTSRALFVLSMQLLPMWQLGLGAPVTVDTEASALRLGPRPPVLSCPIVLRVAETKVAALEQN
jgi:hypothetical protein